MRNTILLAILACLTSVGLLAVLFLHPYVRAREARFERCMENLSAACLTDLAVDTGLSGNPPLPHSNAMTVLRLIGRDEAAHALIVRAEEFAGRTAEEARLAADASMAAPRLARAVRQGMTHAEAYAFVTSATYSNVYIAALDLLGRSPYGPGVGSAVPTAAELAAVRGFAELLVSIAGDLSGIRKEGALECAAELFALLGDHDTAAQVFHDIPRAADWTGIVSAQLMNPTIAADALDVCGDRAECRVRVLHRAALVATTGTEAEALLREAFGIHQDQDPWPDFGGMAEVVALAVERGDSALALDLARTLDQLSQSRKDVFPSVPHIFAARSLLQSGAPVAEVSAALDRAEAEMPGNDGAVIGLGHMGPITWGGGIGSQARWEQASLRAEIGQLDRAIRLMDGIEEPLYAWGQVLETALPPETLDLMLPAAANTLDEMEFLQLRAQTAAEMFWFNGSPAQQTWAVRTARAVMETVDPGNDMAFDICRAAARVAQGASDETLWLAALTCVGETAIQSRDASKLLEAAGLWSTREAAAP